MSYQSAIHFDSTTLLIIKKEIDNSITLVESAVNTLVEEQQLPFGIDDALLQLQQCGKILHLIELPLLAKMTQYSADLMQKIMQDPQHIQAADVKTLGDGFAVLKRYIEFSCLEQVTIPQLLLETLNHLELALNKPMTREGHQVASLLECVELQLDVAPVVQPQPSPSVHALYKLCLLHTCKQKNNALDYVGFKLVGQHLAFLAQHTEHQMYWSLVKLALQHLEESQIHPSRLRALIQLEQNIGRFIQSPTSFESSVADLADIITICLSQDHAHAEQLRHQLNLNDDILSDNQLHFYRKKLLAPDQKTIQTICNLLDAEITTVRKEIEFNHLNLSEERFSHLKQQVQTIIDILKILNMNNTAADIQKPFEQLNHASALQNEDLAQMLMNSLLQALNDLGLLNRQSQSDLLQYRVHNKTIALDRLDNAHESLALELKAVIELATQSLLSYEQAPSADLLENLPNLFKEMSGALLFILNNAKAAQAFSNCAQFLEQQINEQHALNLTQIQYLLDVCASADLLLENRANQLPVMPQMFDVALAHSQQLQSAA
ncbi:chemotaxis protein [Acinetobacter sp. MD2(2019)]|uniref:chemotaxis protein n=1 Tax=Acinetobacter sp. MD2(2019) TaxID=2605273 RepID=UPI002D1F8E96|nr:chemotaxis protein [Acinetobacter sp. MD2(2019)]MEB3753737.1 chemotaxis protein [Acinetobacter sp. MD2(2019)]